MKQQLLLFTVLICLLLPDQSLFADPPDGTDWEPFPPMSDEFNGNTLDTAKWFGTNPSWRGRLPVLFHEACVSVKNGMLQIHAFDQHTSAGYDLPEGYTHLSGFIVSRQLARFGYFEARARLMNASLVSGFWLNHRTTEEWSEITIVEVPAGIEKYKSVLNPNVHYFHGPHYKGTVYHHLVEPSVVELPFNSADEFHVYGFEWTPTHMRWYVDGKLVRESRNRHYFQPLKMNINVEANDYFDALPIDDQLPALYEVDWVRSWRPAREFVPLKDE